MSDEARNLKAHHADTPMEATERRRELLTAYLKQLRKDRRKRKTRGLKQHWRKWTHGETYINMCTPFMDQELEKDRRPKHLRRIYECGTSPMK